MGLSMVRKRFSGWNLRFVRHMTIVTWIGISGYRDIYSCKRGLCSFAEFPVLDHAETETDEPVVEIR